MVPTRQVLRRLYLTVGGGALLLLLFLCFLKPIKLYQTRLVRSGTARRLRKASCPHPETIVGTETLMFASSNCAFSCLQYLDNVLVKPPAVDFSGLRRLW